MLYTVENWDTEEVVKTFKTEEERTKWTMENCYLNYNKWYYEEPNCEPYRIGWCVIL